jgi:GTP-binding protein
MFPTDKIRNIAIIAHVDHGKTTLVDRLLQQSGTLDARAAAPERIMDSNDLERERGITILSKNTAINWNEWRINIVDTPGHADFGGEVERVLSMVDGVLLLVDAVEGPMPQTRFVTQKAFAQGFTPLVVINKIDRDGARPGWVLDQTFEPDVQPDGALQLQVSSLDYNSYVGVLGIGRISRGVARANSRITIARPDGTSVGGRLAHLYGFNGLERIPVEEAGAGDIVVFSGIEDLKISDTICPRDEPDALPELKVDEPTISMTFQVNKSPFAGQDGKFLTSRQIQARLEQELKHNVALRVENTGDPDKFRVSGRGELHLSVLVETMRREGYELAVSRPTVIEREVDGVIHEPWELVTVDFAEEHQGAVMTRLADRKGELLNMSPDGRGRMRLEYRIPARGLIGFRTQYLTVTAGTGLLYSVFDTYAPRINADIGQRNNGVLVSNVAGKALGYSLFNLQERGSLFVSHGVQVYEGMIVGIHKRGNDLPVNPTKGKQLTNIRAAGTDENIQLTPPLNYSLEQALEFIDDDELVEITPLNIRLRKKLLSEGERRRGERLKKKEASI